MGPALDTESVRPGLAGEEGMQTQRLRCWRSLRETKIEPGRGQAAGSGQVRLLRLSLRLSPRLLNGLTFLQFLRQHKCPDLTIGMEKAMTPHSSPLAWKIPWTEEPGGLQSMGSRRVGHD